MTFSLLFNKSAPGVSKFVSLVHEESCRHPRMTKNSFFKQIDGALKVVANYK